MAELICIVCPKGCRLHVDETNGCSVTGNACPRGEAYGKAELTNPTRVITSTVRVHGALHARCPVKTNRPVPKHLIRQAVKALDTVELQAPVQMGQVILPDVCGTGICFVATRNLPKLNIQEELSDGTLHSGT